MLGQFMENSVAFWGRSVLFANFISILTSPKRLFRFKNPKLTLRRELENQTQAFPWLHCSHFTSHSCLCSCFYFLILGNFLLFPQAYFASNQEKEVFHWSSAIDQSSGFAQALGPKSNLLMKVNLPSSAIFTYTYISTGTFWGRKVNGPRQNLCIYGFLYEYHLLKFLFFTTSTEDVQNENFTLSLFSVQL